MGMNSIHVVFAEEDHAKFADEICRLIYESALQRGTGIAKRSPEYIASKIKGGKAVVALDGDRLVGFSYIECWEHGDYVATSGLIVSPDYRHMGLAARIKEKTFELARRRFPYAKIFSITTSLPVMKLTTRPSGRGAKGAATTTSSNATTAACASVRGCSTTRSSRVGSIRVWRPTGWRSGTG